MILSIITINRNNAEGLKKTIESVQIQSFTRFEYIIVDGASTDSSLEIIQQFNNSTAQKFTWISEPDHGVYEAMNKGIKKAKGEYLLFLNSGDFLVNENVLQNVFSTNRTADFLLGRCNISENGVVIHTTQLPEKITFGYIYDPGLAHQSTFIKREMFEKYGYYREDFRYNSDIEFWYRTIVLQCRTTETLQIIISDYNTDGISSKESNTDAYKQEMIEIYSHPLLKQFIPDYDAWITERKDLKILFWFKSKKTIYNLLIYFYKFINLILKIGKKGFNLHAILKHLRYFKHKIQNWWSKPILIFACHQVSPIFNPLTDCKTDWTSTDQFKRNVFWLYRNFTFITLKDAVEMLESGKRRRKRYAVFTFDDGYASIKNALPILEDYKIPATIFINTAYLDDKKLSSVNIVNYINSLSAIKAKQFPSDFFNAVKDIDLARTENEYRNFLAIIQQNMPTISLNSAIYLTKKELWSITDPLFSIAMHGHEHLVSAHLSDENFIDNLILNFNTLKGHVNFTPYYAFPFGSADESKINIVSELGYISFLCNGRGNSKKSKAYNRISIDGIDLTFSQLRN